MVSTPLPREETPTIPGKVFDTVDTRTHLVKCLKEAKGDWVSGESLSAGLSVSRAAIWKHISRLREEGYVIQASPKKGYLLRKATESLLPIEIRGGLKTGVFGKGPIHHLRKTVSTNAVAKDLAASGAPEGTIVVAETQTGGRGRRGRVWFSPPGEGIYMSLILRPALPPGEAPRVTLLAAVALAEALRAGTPLEARIKWPNDILSRGFKLGGILSEISADMDVIDYLVLGVGLNVATAVFPEAFGERATSLFLETGERFSRPALVQGFLERIEIHYRDFLARGFEGIRERWRLLSNTLGRDVIVETMGGRLYGRARDIDLDGCLLIEDREGRRHRVFSGDVSILEEPTR